FLFVLNRDQTFLRRTLKRDPPFRRRALIADPHFQNLCPLQSLIQQTGPSRRPNQTLLTAGIPGQRTGTTERAGGDEQYALRQVNFGLARSPIFFWLRFTAERRY